MRTPESRRRLAALARRPAAAKDRLVAGATTRALALGGSLCWLIVVLTHVAERWHIVPAIGWGLPDSPGHYLDLASALGGAALLLAALIVHRWNGRATRSERQS